MTLICLPLLALASPAAGYGVLPPSPQMSETLSHLVLCLFTPLNLQKHNLGFYAGLLS